MAKFAKKQHFDSIFGVLKSPKVLYVIYVGGEDVVIYVCVCCATIIIKKPLILFQIILLTA